MGHPRKKRRTTASAPEASPPVEAREPGAQATREQLQLWMALARSTWTSLVLVPADPGDSTADLAKILADIGQRLSYSPVTAVTIGALEYGSALALADLQQHLQQGLQTLADVPLEVNAPPVVDVEVDAPPPAAETVTTRAITVAPRSRVIISIPPVISEPLGLAATQEADAVVIGVRMRQTRLRNARRTLELIGRERVAGCFVMP